jgi:hypothetical protein
MPAPPPVIQPDLDSDGQPIVEEVKGPEFSKFPQLAMCPQCHKQVGDNNIKYFDQDMKFSELRSE